MIYLYDGSFDGFLSVVFACYSSKQQPVRIIRSENWQSSFFDTPQKIEANVKHATRVWEGILKQSNETTGNMLYLAFSTELPDVDMELYRYLKKLFADKSRTFYQNLLDENGYNIYRMAAKVRREIHLFYGFVRFQKTSDGLFFSAIQPDNNLVNLLAPHFAARFADQAWVIYDTKRNKGVYYNKTTVSEIILSHKQFNVITGDLAVEAKHENEDEYKALWKAYYKAINIVERKNTRLMVRLLPRRYWKYLPEKN